MSGLVPLVRLARPVRRFALAVAALAGAATLAGAGSFGDHGSAAGMTISSQRLTPVRTCVLTGTPGTTGVVADASVRQAAPTANFGTATTNDAVSSSGANRRFYLAFDLTACSPAIPSGAIVRLATLRLFVSAFSSQCRTLDLFRVAAAWTESTITWSNQPFGTTINNPAAGSASDALDVGNPTRCLNHTTSTYVLGATPTSDVAAFVAGTATNHGWMVRDDAEGSTAARTTTFAAKDAGVVAQAPQLVVTYVTAP